MNLKTHTRTFLAAIAICVGLSAPPAQAQLGLQAGFVEAFQPDFMNRDITLFIDFLVLEDWQVPTVESLKNNLKVMDSTAISLCMDNNLAILVFNLNIPGNLKRVVSGEELGTFVRREK